MRSLRQKTGTGNICIALPGFLSIVLLLALLVVPAGADTSAGSIREYPNTNLAGGTYSTIAAATKDDCAMACLFDPRCQAATWIQPAGQSASCQLKDTVPAMTSSAGNPSLVTYSYVKTTGTPVTTPVSSCPAIAAPGFLLEPASGTAPLKVHLVDTTSGISSVLWNFGDGSMAPGGSLSAVDHTYTTAGTYAVTLTVTDACGKSAMVTKNVVVTGLPAGYGTLTVTTTPAGASLFIGGQAAGTTETPLSVSLTAGVYSIRLSLPGYDDFTDDVTVGSGQTVDLKVTMTRSSGSGIRYTSLAPTPYSDSSLKNALKNAPGTTAAGQAGGGGILTVSSSPAGAAVYLDGKGLGNTPLSVPGIAPGQHSLLLTLPGYADASRDVTISAGAESQVAVGLTAAKKTPGFGSAIACTALLFLCLTLRKIRQG